MATEGVPIAEETKNIQVAETDKSNENLLLTEELRVRTEERDKLKTRLQEIETELAEATKNKAPVPVQKTVPASPVKNELEKEENLQLRDVVGNLKLLVKEKTTACSRYVLQIQALETQVAALKEVTSLTKGMLSIRNTENDKLKEQIDLMQKKVDSERVRNNAVLKKTELASSLNVQLRTEYQNQVKLIGELRQKYEKKISILTGEVERLQKERHPLTNGDVANGIE